MKGKTPYIHFTKFGGNWYKGIGTGAKNLNLTLDFGVTLNFDLSKIQLDALNGNVLKLVHTKFGFVIFKTLHGTERVR